MIGGCIYACAGTGQPYLCFNANQLICNDTMLSLVASLVSASNGVTPARKWKNL